MVGEAFTLRYMPAREDLNPLAAFRDRGHPQRKAVEDFLNGGRWDLIAGSVEVESGKRDDRPKLAEALSLCRLYNATLVIAKLDRLSRDAHFRTTLGPTLRQRMVV